MCVVSLRIQKIFCLKSFAAFSINSVIFRTFTLPFRLVEFFSVFFLALDAILSFDNFFMFCVEIFVTLEARATVEKTREKYFYSSFS